MAHWHLNPLATPVGCCLICFPYPCTSDQILQWQRLIWRDKLNHLDLSGVGPRTENSEGGLRFIYLVCIKVKPNDWWLLVFITPSDNYVCRGDDWASNLLFLTSFHSKHYSFNYSCAKMPIICTPRQCFRLTYSINIKMLYSELISLHFLAAFGTRHWYTPALPHSWLRAYNYRLSYRNMQQKWG